MEYWRKITPGEKSPGAHFIGGWVDPQDTKEWRKISIPPTAGIEPEVSSSSQVSHSNNNTSFVFLLIVMKYVHLLLLKWESIVINDNIPE